MLNPSTRLSAKLSLLFGTASAFTLATVVCAQAQGAAAAPIEEVLVTGSLIHGAAAVGVPVTALGQQDFKETGALTVGELLRTIPAIQVEASTSVANGGGQINRSTSVDIHGLNSNTAPRTLMLIDSKRFPAQGHGADRYDPSIVPQLAVDHVDVLVDGASATYGSDAVAGVLNVILRRGYDGAITQLRYGSAQGGDHKWQASQLFGRKWDSGDVTLSYEWYDETALPGTARATQFTFNYTPWGLDDRTLISSSIPAVVSLANIGSANRTQPACTACFSLPHGIGWNYGDTPAHTNPAARVLPTDGVPTVAWTTVQGLTGARNEVNPYSLADVTANQQRNGATITFDQMIVNELGVVSNVELFIDGFYSNRRVKQAYPVLVNPARNDAFLNQVVPTTNPYYPSGAPAGLRVHYNFSKDMQPVVRGAENSARWTAGFNFDLLEDWRGRFFYAANQEKNRAIGEDTVNVNSVSAALGNTVPSVAAAGTKPGVAAFTKPANVPFLNVFCDPFVYTCNSPITLDYIRAFRDFDETYYLNEWGANFDGPLFTLPGGPVRAALGASYYVQTYEFVTRQNFQTVSAGILDVSTDHQRFNVTAFYGQLNVPLVGDDNALPFIRKLDLEGAYRYDRYSTFGSTTNPKLSLNWSPIQDLTFRASWGTSFRAPAFGDNSFLAGVQIQSLNGPAGEANTLPICLTGEVSPPAGSAAAVLISQLPGSPTTCAGAQTALNALSGAGSFPFPGGITVRGGAGGATLIRGGATGLGPEEAETYSMGFQYEGSDFLSGLHVESTYFDVIVDNVIQGLESLTGAGLRDPALRFTYILKDDPNFASYVATLIRDTRSTVSLTAESNILFINDGAVRNAGSTRVNGIDFSIRYDWDGQALGAWSAGIDGTYFTRRKLVTAPGLPPILNYDAPWTDVFGVSYPNGQTQACLFCTPPVPPRFKYRARLGWELDNFNATLFMNYQSHFFNQQVYPPAVIANPSAFPNYSNLQPSYITFDLSLGYNSGTDPANEYLQNIDVRLVAQNALDKPPPFMYKVSSGGSNPAAFDVSLSPVGRVITLIVTKTW